MATHIIISNSHSLDTLRETWGAGMEDKDFEVLKSIFEDLHIPAGFHIIDGCYRNGNYWVVVLTNGSKFRFNTEDSLEPSFAESMDVTITYRCDGHCPYCYAGCTDEGAHGELLDMKFLDGLHPFTELALNANDLSHPQLEDFLRALRDRRIFPSITINEKHMAREENLEKIYRWLRMDLIRGVGVSFTGDGEPASATASQLRDWVQDMPSAVVHVIAGIITPAVFQQLMEMNLGGHRLKLLVLGYKTKGRGVAYAESANANIEHNRAWLESWMEKNLMAKNNGFQAIAFDTLAVQQLRIKEKIPADLCETRYMGDDGAYTFFVDLVHRTYARSSLAAENFPMGDLTPDEMFHRVQVQGTHREGACHVE